MYIKNAPMHIPGKAGLALALLAVMGLAAPHAKAQDLFVSSLNSHAILRYDATTGAFLDSFASVGDQRFPEGLVFGPDNNLYVSTITSGVLRYNGATGAFIDAFVPPSALLGSPIGLVFGPDKNLYVSSFDNSSVLRYEGTTGAFIDAFVPSGSGALNLPRGLAFGPDGDLYVAKSAAGLPGNNPGSVLRYDGTTGAFIDPFVPSGSGGLDTAIGLAFGPDGNLYVSSGHTNSVLRYNAVTGEFIDAFIPPGNNGLSTPSGLAFGPDGNLYVSSQGSNRILRYDGTTGAFLNALDNGSGGLSGPSFLTFRPAAIPEPGTLFLLGLGLLLTFRRRPVSESPTCSSSSMTSIRARAAKRASAAPLPPRPSPRVAGSGRSLRARKGRSRWATRTASSASATGTSSGRLCCSSLWQPESARRLRDRSRCSPTAQRSTPPRRWWKGRARI